MTQSISDIGHASIVADSRAGLGYFIKDLAAKKKRNVCGAGAMRSIVIFS
jgi:hypothetical protein